VLSLSRLFLGRGGRARPGGWWIVACFSEEQGGAGTATSVDDSRSNVDLGSCGRVEEGRGGYSTVQYGTVRYSTQYHCTGPVKYEVTVQSCNDL
jgi:hypothetical protein